MRLTTCNLWVPAGLATVAAALLIVIYALYDSLSAPVALGLIVLVSLCLAFAVHCFDLEMERQRIRKQTIYKIHLMLEDVVRNYLTIIAMNAYFLADKDNQHVQRIDEALEAIIDHLDNLSDDTLDQWEDRYEDIMHTTYAIYEK